MKKLLLLSAVALGGITANAQWVENFDSSTNLPDGWAVINDGDPNGFTFGAPSGDAQTPSNVAKIYYHNQQAHDDYLITKAIPVSLGVSDRISFWVKSRSDTSYQENYSVLLSTTDQTKAAFNVELQATEKAPSNWEKQTFNLSAYDGQTVYVAVHATDLDQYELYVDSFVVDGAPSCAEPEDVLSSNVAATTADISWTASASTVNVGYQVYYSTTNTAPNDTTVLDNTNSVTVDGTTTTAALTGLMPNTTYYAWVRANCSATDSSIWTSSVSFTTTATCTVPTNISSSNVEATTAGISWTASTSTVSVGYQVYYSTTNTAPNNTTELNDTNSVTVGALVTTTALTGLTPETTYYVWVRANCDATDNSSWSASISFKTDCAKKVPDYLQNFDNISMDQYNISIQCWILAKGGDATTGYTSLGGSSWRGKEFLNDTSNTRAAAIDLYSTAHKGWMISPTFDLSGGASYQLTFDYGGTKYYGTDPSPMGVDDYVQLLVSTNGGSTWTVIETWDANNTPSNVSTTYTLDLAPYIGSETMIAFYGTDGTVDDTVDFLFFVDNFAVTDTSGVGTINQELASLNVYPNPAKDVINISNDLMINNVEVYDINGRRLLNQSVGQTSTTIDVSSFASGTYFVKVTAEGKTSTKQIIVK